MENKILILGFEAMHRAGKGTQIDLLKDYLENQRGIPTFVFKCHGKMKGNFEDELYTKTNYKSFSWNIFKLAAKFNSNPRSKINAWQKAAKYLENNVNYFIQKQLPKILKEKNSNLAVILLDRTLITKFQLELQENENYSFKKILQKAIVKPDYYFFLDLPQNILLKEAENDLTDNKDHRIEMLTKNYKFALMSIENSKSILNESLFIIDGMEGSSRKNIEKVHLEIKDKVDLIIRDYLYS